MMNLCTIIPPATEPGGLTKTQGTRVVLPDGAELGGVTRVVLTADVGDVWRAEIHCHAKVGVMAGMLARVHGPRPAWWRRLLCRLAGVTIDSTDLGSAAIETRRP